MQNANTTQKSKSGRRTLISCCVSRRMDTLSSPALNLRIICFIWKKLEWRYGTLPDKARRVKKTDDNAPNTIFATPSNGS